MHDVLPTNHVEVSQSKTRRSGKINIRVRVPGPGSVNVLVTAWDDNLADATTLLQPAPYRFVIRPRAFRRHRGPHASPADQNPTRAANCC
jgi:hypothetical protein